MSRDDGPGTPCPHCDQASITVDGCCVHCGAPRPAGPICTFALSVDGEGHLVECGAPIVSVWMETRTCERGHVTSVIEPTLCDACGEPFTRAFDSGDEAIEILDAMPGEPELVHARCIDRVRPIIDATSTD